MARRLCLVVIHVIVIVIGIGRATMTGHVSTTFLLVMALEQSDATHHGNTRDQCKKEGKAVVAVKLHFGQEVGKSDEEKSSSRKCQGRARKLTLHVLFSRAARQTKGHYPDRHHQRKAELDQPHYLAADTLAV